MARQRLLRQCEGGRCWKRSRLLKNNLSGFQFFSCLGQKRWCCALAIEPVIATFASRFSRSGGESRSELLKKLEKINSGLDLEVGGKSMYLCIRFQKKGERFKVISRIREAKKKRVKKVGGRYCGFEKISDLCTPLATAGRAGITRDAHTNRVSSSRLDYYRV